MVNHGPKPGLGSATEPVVQWRASRVDKSAQAVGVGRALDVDKPAKRVCNAKARAMGNKRSAAGKVQHASGVLQTFF